MKVYQKIQWQEILNIKEKVCYKEDLILILVKCLSTFQEEKVSFVCLLPQHKRHVHFIIKGSFGYDEKYFIPPHVMRNSLINPPPGSYDIPTDFESNKYHKRGSSFG